MLRRSVVLIGKTKVDNILFPYFWDVYLRSQARMTQRDTKWID